MCLFCSHLTGHLLPQGEGSTNLPCAQEKKQKSDDSLSHYHGLALVHKIMLQVDIIMANLKVEAQGMSLLQDHNSRSL